MNFLRNFLQGKEPPTHKKSRLPLNNGENNIAGDPREDLYPLSRSATDPSNSASLIKSGQGQGQSCVPSPPGDDQSRSVNKEDNNDDHPSSSLRETLHSGDYKLDGKCFQPIETKSYLERPSFKVEGVLSHHLNSNQNQESQPEEPATAQKETPKYSPSPNESEVALLPSKSEIESKTPKEDVNESLKVTQNNLDEKETSQVQTQANSCVSSSQSDLVNDTDIKDNEVETDITYNEGDANTKEIENTSNYLEFVFEDCNEPLKVPPRLLGKRNQRKSKNKSGPNHKHKPRSNSPYSSKVPLDTSDIVKETQVPPLTHTTHLPFSNSESNQSINLEQNPSVEQKTINTDTCDTLSNIKKPNTLQIEVQNFITNNEIKEQKETLQQVSENINTETLQQVSENINTEKESLQNLETEKKDSNFERTKLVENSAQPLQQPNRPLTPSLENTNPTSPSNNKNLNTNQFNLARISCYGNEEFEILGNEANKLAEELGNCDNSSLSNKKMEDFNSSEDCLKNINSFENLNLDINRKSSNRRDSSILHVSDSEAGPDIATGLTSSDLKCASQFFREAAELESQIRRNIASSIGSLNDFGSEGGRSSYTSESDVFERSMKGAAPNSPPHEERSAPEGTSSPDPRSLEDSEVRSRLQRSPTSSNSPEVNELLKKQALEFEEKLLRQGIVSAEKEKELHELLKEEHKQIQQLTASRDALLKLVEQYKGMLAALVGEKSKSNTSLEEKIKTLEAEKMQAIEDLNNVEAAFSDVHRKYERTKQIVDTLRRNEETLRDAVADYEQKLLKQERKFTELQKHAEEKIKIVNDEFDQLRRCNDQEMTKMGALLKKAEMKIISLQDALERKCKENQELTQLCDDLISKVGS